jgi:hypothetical protein
MPLSLGIDCAGASAAVTCTVELPDSLATLSVPGVDVSSLLAAVTGTTTYTGAQVAFATASVTAGGEKLSAGSAGASGSGGMAGPSANGTMTGGATPSATKPAEQTNAAAVRGVEVAALFGVVGAAVAQLL